VYATQAFCIHKLQTRLFSASLWFYERVQLLLSVQSVKHVLQHNMFFEAEVHGNSKAEPTFEIVGAA